MKTLVIIVEGQTEEAFVRDLLTPELTAHGIWPDCRIVHPRQMGSRSLHRGGGGWPDWRAKIKNALRDSRPDLSFTTLFDLYGLPAACPGRTEALRLASGPAKADCIERALRAEFGDERFMPYVQVHEFEALVLAALDGLEGMLDASADLEGLAKLRARIAPLSPEDINDGPDTAPSKRLLAAIPSYDKLVHGPGAIEAVGLAHIRAACPRFASWLNALVGDAR